MNNDELLTWASLLTLQGAAAAVLAVTNVLGSVVGDAFNSIRKWLALGLSLALGFAALLSLEKLTLESWVVAGLNGFMIAAAVLGVNEAGAALRGGPRSATAAQGNTRFWQGWL
jgi:hypothetical protein